MIGIRIRDEDVLGLGQSIEMGDCVEYRDCILESDYRYEDQDKGVEIRYKEQKMKLDMCRGFGWICVDQSLSKEFLMM